MSNRFFVKKMSERIFSKPKGTFYENSRGYFCLNWKPKDIFRTQGGIFVNRRIFFKPKGVFYRPRNILKNPRGTFWKTQGGILKYSRGIFFSEKPKGYFLSEKPKGYFLSEKPKGVFFIQPKGVFFILKNPRVFLCPRNNKPKGTFLLPGTKGAKRYW